MFEDKLTDRGGEAMFEEYEAGKQQISK